MLEKINYPQDLKELTINEKQELAEDIRRYLIDVVSKNGGHLSSNLGVVELTIAIHSVFDIPKDKLIFDVGHQCYVHKILTGRKKQLKSIRKLEGISGFPKTKESKYDSFDTGHSSTSISVALGMARANKLKGISGKVISVIGDGSLTGGMAMEALNDAGSSKADIIVILNDNGMSISKNVGGITKLLTKIRIKKAYERSNNFVKRMLSKVPVIGKCIIYLAHAIKKGLKKMMIPNMYFEDLGFKYLGPVDGHNIKELENILSKAKNMEGPILIHTVTKKGKGYKYAEENPDKFHGVSPFNAETGEVLAKKEKDYSKVFGDKLVELAKKDKNIVAVTASMKDGTGLNSFALNFPERFFDVGIAESHAVGLIAGMAKAGLKPVFAVYSSFLQRGYDELIHDVALGKLPVVIGIDRAGIVGADGETHQGLFDLTYLNHIPNFVIMSPKDFNELEEMIEFAFTLDKPVAIRYPRGNEGKIRFKNADKISLGKSEVIKEGKDITIVAIGKMVQRAVEVSDLLKGKDINAEIINTRFLKPLDTETIIKSAKKTGRVVTIEDGVITGGLYTSVTKCVNENRINTNVLPFGYGDIFIEHGSIDELEKKYGMDKESICEKIIESMKKQ